MRSLKSVKKHRKVTDRRGKAKHARNKLKKKTNKFGSHPLLGKDWDKTKTVRRNLQELGLAYDPNEAIAKPKVESLEIEEMEIASIPSLNAQQKNQCEKIEGVPVITGDANASITTTKLSKGQKKRRSRAAKKRAAADGDAPLVSRLESAAADAAQRQEEKRVVRLHGDQVRFCSEMITKHGLDFEAMARDPKNIWQQTARQIERSIELFKKSPAYKTHKVVEAMEF